MSRTSRLVGATMVPALAVPIVASVATARGAHDVPPPPKNSNLPRELDVASPYLPQTICDPDAKPGVTAFARLMANHYSEFSYGISRACNYGLTEHSEGRALDWMLNAYDPHERAVADSVLAWLLAPDSQGRPAAMARRFGIMYIIWDRKIWGTYNMSAGWRPYNGVSPHTDHIHFSFSWDGAMQRTSWWTGRAWTGVTTTPGGPSVPIADPTSYPTLRQGASGSDVALAQKVIGVSADGQFGPATLAALKTWQGKNGLSRTGVLDKATWDKMVALGKIPARGASDGGLSRYFDTSVRLGSSGAAVKALQRTLGITADGQFGSGTEKAVRAFQKKKSLRVDGIVTNNVWQALAGLDYKKNGKTAPKPKPNINATVRLGSSGASVRELQKRLKIDVDGQFGPGTQKAVREFQRKKGLIVDGIVTKNVWNAINGKPYRQNGKKTTPKPKPAPEVNATVRRGSSGASVRELQKKLKIGVDGQFGPGTEKAVREFQRKKGLIVDGIVTKNVWNAINGKPYRQNGKKTTPKPKPAPEVNATVRRGSIGPSVRELQKKLGIDVDGKFGSGTEKAVKDFQKKKSLRVDGIVTQNVWNALNGKSYTKNGASTPRPRPSTPPPPPAVKTTTEYGSVKSHVVAKGARGAAVKVLQRALGGVAVDGSFGATTEKALKSFQWRNKIPTTGIADARTWEALERRDYPLLMYRTQVLKQGSKGYSVTLLQRYLGVTPDGQFGSSTTDAVKALQGRHGLSRTGYVGGLTWQALEREIRARRAG